MSDYINREDVINKLDELCDIVCVYSKVQRAAMCGGCPLGIAFDVIEEFPACDNWISVKERLPSESGNYLIVVSGTTELDYYSETIGWDCDGVTHWMPLPEPPKEEDNG